MEELITFEEAARCLSVNTEQALRLLHTCPVCIRYTGHGIRYVKTEVERIALQEKELLTFDEVATALSLSRAGVIDLMSHALHSTKVRWTVNGPSFHKTEIEKIRLLLADSL